MQFYGFTKYLNSKKGRHFIEGSYRIASKEAKQWASDARFIKFHFREPAEGGNKLEYSFISELKGRTYVIVFGGWGLPGLKYHASNGTMYRTEFLECYIPIDTCKWKIPIAQVWEKALDIFRAKGIWNNGFSQVHAPYSCTILEMMNPDTLVWETELFGLSVPSEIGVSAGFVIDATTGAIIRDKPITQDLLHKGEILFRKKDYCGALRTYGKLRQYPGWIYRDEVRNRMIECMKELENKFPKLQVTHGFPTDLSVTLCSFFTIVDSCWKNPVYCEVEKRELYKITCKIYYTLGYRRKLTGKLPEYSMKALKWRNATAFDFAVQVMVGLDGKIEPVGSRGRKHIILVSTGYPDWDNKIMKLLNETWEWQPLPVTTSGIIYFQFRPYK